MLRLLSLFFVSSAFLFISIPFFLRGDFYVFRGPLLKLGLIISPLFFLTSIALDRITFLLRKYSITITESTIIYEGFFNRKSFQFNEIEKFQYIKYFPFGVRGRLATNRDEILIPLFIEELPLLIKNIRKSLNLLSKSDAYKNGNIVDFDIKARYNELVSDLMFNSVPYLATSFLIVLAIDVVAAFHFWEIPLIFVILWIIQSIFYPSAAYLLSFSIISEKIKNEIKKNPECKELKDISGVFIYSGIFFTILYLLSGIALRYIVQTQWVRF